MCEESPDDRMMMLYWKHVSCTRQPDKKEATNQAAHTRATSTQQKDKLPETGVWRQRENMKTVILALSVLLVAVDQSEALKCYCGGQKLCSDRIETCTGATNVCGSILITAGSRPTYSQGCMTAWDCSRLNYPGISSCHSCGFDLCNR